MLVSICSCCSMIQEYYQLQQDPTIDHIPVYRKVDWLLSINDILTGICIGFLVLLHLYLSCY